MSPSFSSSAYRSATSGRTPVRPEVSVCRRSSISALVVSSSTSAPVPAACERTREACSRSLESTSIFRSARAPNPVETP